MSLGITVKRDLEGWPEGRFSVDDRLNPIAGDAYCRVFEKGGALDIDQTNRGPIIMETEAEMLRLVIYELRKDGADRATVPISLLERMLYTIEGGKR